MRKLVSKTLSLLLVLGSSSTLVAITSAVSLGCSSTPDATGPERLVGDSAELQYFLKVNPQGTSVLEPSEEAIRNALINGGFRLAEEEKDADVVLDLNLTDADEPQFFNVTVNGKAQLKKRRVTAQLTARAADTGKSITQKSHEFVVDDDAAAVDEEEVVPLVRMLTGNEKLSRYANKKKGGKGIIKKSVSAEAPDSPE